MKNWVESCIKTLDIMKTLSQGFEEIWGAASQWKIFKIVKSVKSSITIGFYL